MDGTNGFDEPGPRPLDHVYVAVAGDYVKIGAAYDVDKRLDAIGVTQASCRRPASTIGVRPVLVQSFHAPRALEVERALLDAFIEEREVGEWFRIEGRMARWLEMRRKPWADLIPEYTPPPEWVPQSGPVRF